MGVTALGFEPSAFRKIMTNKANEVLDTLLDDLNELVDPCTCSECKHDARDHSGRLDGPRARRAIIEALDKLKATD